MARAWSLVRMSRLCGALSLAWIAAACTGGSATERAEERTPELAIFVFDRSNSVTRYQLGLARELTNQRIDGLTHRDRIGAVQVFEQTLEERPRRWLQEVPDREWKGARLMQDSVSRERFLQDAKDYLRAFTDTVRREQINATDILSTLHEVSAIVRASPDHRPTLYIFSDMLHANRLLNLYSSRHMPPPGWIEEARADGRLPDLTGLCVVIVGARTDTHAGQRVKEFWKSYFEATGAALQDENYTFRPVRLPDRPCPGPARPERTG